MSAIAKQMETYDALAKAAEAVLSHRIGKQPTRGYLRDTYASRAALGQLEAVLERVRQLAAEQSK